jgi:hypothetical protein
LRNAVNQASQAFSNAGTTATNLGDAGSGISSTLTPELTAEAQHPEGYSQQDQSAMLSAGLGGAGGGASALTGIAGQRAATTGNAGGFTSALDEAARLRAKQGAGVAENIAAKNAGLKQEQQQEGLKGLEGMYGEDTSGMLKAMALQPEDVNAEVGANKTGWNQNALAWYNGVANGGKGGGGQG